MIAKQTHRHCYPLLHLRHRHRLLNYCHHHPLPPEENMVIKVSQLLRRRLSNHAWSGPSRIKYFTSDDDPPKSEVSNLVPLSPPVVSGLFFIVIPTFPLRDELDETDNDGDT